MKTPPFLFGAALLLWGWQSGLMSLALLLAVVLEAAHWTEWRVEFDVADFNRLADLCAVLLALAGVYCFVSRGTTNEVMAFLQATSFTRKSAALTETFQSAFIFFQWWPALLAPLLFAQAYTPRPAIPVSCLIFLQRRRSARLGRPQPATPAINLTYPGFAVVLFSASLTGSRESWFYFAFSALMAWALWANRPRRFSNVIWIAALILVVKAGYFGHRQLNDLQTFLENNVANWLSSFVRRQPDRTATSTAIGHFGRLKLSGKIVLRVNAESRVPTLLRDASYTTYRGTTWYAGGGPLEPVLAIDDALTWPLRPDKATPFSVGLSFFTAREQAYLPVPNGIGQLRQLSAAEVRTNSHGFIHATGLPGFLSFRALHGSGPGADSPPDEGPESADLAVPAREAEAIEEIAVELGVEGMSPQGRVQAVTAFFATKFRYGTFLSRSLEVRGGGTTPLSFFLLKNRVGHCEYYATAAVLLLRHAGIPARYASGWSVQEQEKGTGDYVVRERHGHAWCLYWLDGAWRDLDTTPSAWAETESENASIWEPLADRWSRFRFAFARWRWYGDTGDMQRYLLAGLAALVPILAWRLFARRRRRRLTAGNPAHAPSRQLPGDDSEFYQVERRCEELGFERRRAEPLGDWVKRLETSAAFGRHPLRGLLDLHYRYRFDPRGLTSDERGNLSRGVESWLAQAAPPNGR